MLHILWMLLKIIGIIILVILGLVLITLGVVFLVPLKYNGSAVLDKEKEKSTVKLKFSWLLYLISGNVSYIDKQLTYEIRVLGKKLQLNQDNDNIEEFVENKEKEVEAEDNLAKKITKDVISDVISDVTEEPSTTSSEKKTNKQVKKKKPKKESVLKKIKYTFQNICDKIKMLKQKKDKVETFLKNETHKSAFKKLWKEIGKLLKSLKPKHLKVNAHFGFEDPSITGKVLAVLSILYPFYGDNIKIQPDFENVVIEGDLYLKGKIRVIYAVRLAWNLIWNKNVRTTLKDILKWNKQI